MALNGYLGIMMLLQHDAKIYTDSQDCGIAILNPADDDGKGVGISAKSGRNESYLARSNSQMRNLRLVWQYASWHPLAESDF